MQLSKYLCQNELEFPRLQLPNEKAKILHPSKSVNDGARHQRSNRGKLPRTLPT
jgi:hypothetical protein